MSQAGSISISSASGSTFIISPGVLVDMTSAGAKFLFSPIGDFFVTDLFTVGVNIVTPADGAVFAIGWTAPNYVDLDPNANFPDSILANGETSAIDFSSFDIKKILPFGQTLTIKINNPSTAATDIEMIYVTGFYI